MLSIYFELNGFESDQRLVNMWRVAIKPFIGVMAVLIIIVSVTTGADTIRGELIKAEGQVQIVDGQGRYWSFERYGPVVRELDTIVTAGDSHAVIQFTDGTLTVLDQNSRLRVEKTGWLSHIGGKIYFTFKRFFGESRQVKTRFATLGIRGTTFIVTDDDIGQSVALAEGLLEIQTPGAAFEIHRQRQQDEFRAYKRQAQQQQLAEQREFDDYRQQLQQDFVEFKKSFSLQANRIVRFEGNRVEEAVIDADVQAEFEYFEAIAGVLLDAFHEQSDQQ